MAIARLAAPQMMRCSMRAVRRRCRALSGPSSAAGAAPAARSCQSHSIQTSISMEVDTVQTHSMPLLHVTPRDRVLLAIATAAEEVGNESVQKNGLCWAAQVALQVAMIQRPVLCCSDRRTPPSDVALSVHPSGQSKPRLRAKPLRSSRTVPAPRQVTTLRPLVMQNGSHTA